MKIRSTIALLTLLFAGMGLQAQAQNLKIGVVNYEKIVQELPEAKQARQALETYAKSLQDTLKMYETSFGAELESFKAQREMMTEAGRAQKEEELQALQQQALMYRQSATARLAEKERELLEPILKKIEDAVDKLAKEEKLDLILNSGSASTDVIFAAEKIDYTFRLLDGLKRQ